MIRTRGPTSMTDRAPPATTHTLTVGWLVSSSEHCASHGVAGTGRGGQAETGVVACAGVLAPAKESAAREREAGISC